MGWCSGTDVFDSFCSALLNPKMDVDEALEQIIGDLEGLDWDCQQDSDYWENPRVRKAFIKLHPHWFNEDGEEDDD